MKLYVSLATLSLTSRIVLAHTATYLNFLVHPVVRKISHRNRLPVVRDLSARAVYYVRHFIRHYEV